MSVKQNLKPFKAWLHYGDASNPPMHTASFYGNRYDLNVLIRQAEAEGEPLRVQIEDEGGSKRRATKRKRSYTTRSKSGRSKKQRYRVLRRGVAKRRLGQKRRYKRMPRGQYHFMPGARIKGRVGGRYEGEVISSSGPTSLDRITFLKPDGTVGEASQGWFVPEEIHWPPSKK